MENEKVIRKRAQRSVKKAMILVGEKLNKSAVQMARESNLYPTSFQKGKENQKISADAFVDFLANNPELNVEYFIYENTPMFKNEINQIGQNNQQGDNNNQFNQTGNNSHQYNNTGEGTQNNIHSLGNQFNFAANAAENLKIIRNYFESNAERGTADEYARRTLDRLEQQVQQYESIIEHYKTTIESQQHLIDVLQQTVEHQKVLLKAKE